MSRWMAALDAGCARVNPGLVLVAVCIGLLDLTLAARRWAAAHPGAVPVETVVVAAPAEGGRPDLPPGSRDMLGRD